MTITERIHYYSVENIKLETASELVLESKPGKVFNPVFVIGCILFAGGMFLKANVDAEWAAIPLGAAALILLSGVWILSANAKLVFDCYEQKVLRIYSHLGYLRKIYSVPLLSIEKMEIKVSDGINKIILLRDNGDEIMVSNSKALTGEKAEEICTSVNDFLKKKR